VTLQWVDIRVIQSGSSVLYDIRRHAMIQLDMRRTNGIFSVLLVVAAVATLALVVREYLRARNVTQLFYTRSVKKHDILDAAQRAFAALNDAELREQYYVLTGETVYSEAYAEDIRNWQDEYGALELVAEKDPATPLVQDLSKAGKRTLDELALISSLYDKGGRDAALERIRKGSGIVYLDQARNIAAKIQEVDGGAADLISQRLTRNAVSALLRLEAAGGALFTLTVTATLLLFVESRRSAGITPKPAAPVV
jgi:CHASE3 domain sensor protein